VAVAVLEAMLAPYESGGRLVLLRNHQVTSAEVNGAEVRSLGVLDLDDGRIFTFTIDGLEAGDKLFHRTLSRLVEEARKKAGKSAMKAGAEATE